MCATDLLAREGERRSRGRERESLFLLTAERSKVRKDARSEAIPAKRICARDRYPKGGDG
jgi:hypothetical protein